MATPEISHPFNANERKGLVYPRAVRKLCHALRCRDASGYGLCAAGASRLVLDWVLCQEVEQHTV